MAVQIASVSVVAVKLWLHAVAFELLEEECELPEPEPLCEEPPDEPEEPPDVPVPADPLPES